MGFFRLFCKSNQWNSIQVRVRLLSIQQTVAKVLRDIPQSKPLSPQNLSTYQTKDVYSRIKCLIGIELPHVLSGLRCPKYRRDLTQQGRCYCTSTKISRDVVLFHHDRTRFVRLLATFCGAQTLFWTYLAHFAYTGLRNDSSLKEQRKVTTTGLAGFWSFDINLGRSVWRYGFTGGCLAVGAGIIGLGVLFCRRSVSRVILHQGGKMVTVATQSPLGPDKGRQITVPLSRVACHAHRNESPSFIPLKIKDNIFYFLLDKEGTINNAQLFDVTVGAYRPL
ncbi:transmembrane protein 223 [Gadus chalcogrammus]|uniref:transmembrane protein 223 n=1 Tax=Gadus chalcogrammus TaxID=1042646 RepID=UPI0024C47E32|nr:transmembrane protein 223 [Gadus chalcogrammus]